MTTFPARPGALGHRFNVDVVGTYGTVPNIGLSVGNAAFPTANKIFYMPFRIPSPILVQQLYVSNGTVSGNVDVGIYDLSGRRIVSSGSVAQAGASANQLVDITDTLLGRGAYYWAVTLDNTTGQLIRATVAVGLVRLAGVLIEAAASFGLPAQASFASAVDTYFPLGGLMARSVL